MYLRSIQISFLLAAMLFWSSGVIAQVSEGGLPKSFSSAIVDESMVLVNEFDKPAVEELLAEDIIRDNAGMNLRDAVAVPVGLGIDNAGIWFNQLDGSRIWRLKVRIPQALSLEPNFDQFFIPAGAELHIYDEEGSQVFGAYTNQNNHIHGRLSLEMIQGDVINFEYYEPLSVIGEGIINLLDIGYRYRDVIGLDPVNENGGANDCEVDVNCIEGLDWDDQIRSTIRIRTRINGQFFWCSGTIMNNTSEDCRPLILTSLRCAIDGNDISGVSDFDFYRFYFGYESEGCGGAGSATPSSMAGCLHLGDSNDGGGAMGSDYLILELNNDIPSSYDPFYAGWNATGLLDEDGGVMIHHPSGDVKKISTYSGVPSSSGWGIDDTHWEVQWSATDNGHGVHELGSAGASLFNGSGQVIGTLTGGASFCDDTHPEVQELPDLFGKVSYHWEQNPNSMDEKLKAILDPSGQGLLSFEGDSAPCVTNVLENADSWVSVFPNPTADLVEVSVDRFLSPGSMYRLSDVTGRMIFEAECDGEKQFKLDLGGMQDGVYLLSIILPESNQWSATRIVVRR